MNKKSTDTFYWDVVKQERLRVVYRVYLTMPGWYYGRVDIEADSEEEAARLALDEKFCEIDWYDSDRDDGCAEVNDIICEDQPENAFLIGKNRGNVNLDVLFGSEEKVPESTLPPASGHKPDTNSVDGVDPCK